MIVIAQLGNVNVTAFGIAEAAVDEAVKAYKNLSEKGKTISELDFLIVGIAVANNETLVTGDKDFLKLKSDRITVLPQH